MFSRWFSGKSAENKPKAPEVMGLYLGGSFQLDPLTLRLLEPELTIEGAAPSQLILAVGEAQLDNNSVLLRFYTDDDAFLQVVLDGGRDAQHVTDVKLWHFYETLSIGSDAEWQQCLRQTISQPSYELNGHQYTRVWQAISDPSPPVAVTETTYDEKGDTSTTDQFMMLYERPIANGRTESLLVVGEEKIIDNRADRCLVISTGFDLGPADINING